MNSLRRDRRALLIGGTVILAMLLTARVLPALRRFEATAALELLAAEQRLDDVERELRLLGSTLEGASARTPGGSARVLESAFEGTTPTESVAAAMQQLVGIATTLGATVRAVTPQSEAKFRNGVTALSIRISFATDAVGLDQLLAELARGDRLLVPRTLAVQASTPAAPTASAEVIQVDMTVAAIARARVAEMSP